MARKKRRRRKNELAVPAVPLRMYHDEKARRAVIRCLEKQLKRARAVLRTLQGNH